MDPYQPGDQPQQYQFASGYVSMRPNPEAQPMAQEGGGWQIAQHHPSAGKRAAHERARTASESGRSPNPSRTRTHGPETNQMQAPAQAYYAMAQQQQLQPNAAGAYTGLYAALAEPAGNYSNPESGLPSHHPSPLHSESSGLPVRRAHMAHMAHALQHTRPAFRPALLVPA